MARGRKTGGGSRRGALNDSTLASQGLAMRAVVAALVLTKELLDAPEEARARLGELLGNAVTDLAEWRRDMQRKTKLPKTLPADAAPGPAALERDPLPSNPAVEIAAPAPPPSVPVGRPETQEERNNREVALQREQLAIRERKIRESEGSW